VGREAPWLKRVVLAGALGGALATVAMALLLDTIYGDALGGSWREAIVHDLETFLNWSVEPQDAVVSLLLALTMLLLAVFGGLMGVAFSFFLYRFFQFLRER